MTLYDIPVQTLAGEYTTLREYAGGPMLIVNVASKCGLTPQYETLQELHEEYAPRGLTVLGFPCNQFMAQEPGTPSEIMQFCSVTYGVTFPLFAKIDVNGPERHPLYEVLVQAADSAGVAGDVQWNFEKFLVGADGAVRRRFRPQVKPLSEEIVGAIDAELARV
ncbi:MAG: glutathione peroxidase [Pseudonocardiales bacterium]|nr:glutathione peroxidase [Pseudonocardiales bacterium]